MRGLRPLNAAWKVPTILTDASLQIELVRRLWPDMKLVSDIAVEAQHQHIRQIIAQQQARPPSPPPGRSSDEEEGLRKLRMLGIQPRR